MSLRLQQRRGQEDVVETNAEVDRSAHTNPSSPANAWTVLVLGHAHGS